MTANHSTDDEIEMSTFGPWTLFKSMVTDNRTRQSHLDYFLEISYPLIHQTSLPFFARCHK